MANQKTLLILGAGFSRAISEEMPTLNDLTTYLLEFLEEKHLDQDHYKRFLKQPISDPEALLTYLGSEQPWKNPAEIWEDKANFRKIQNELANFIESKEETAFNGKIPEWSEDLIRFLHNSKISVISFNYDTVLERINYLTVEKYVERNEVEMVASWPSTPNLYDMPLSPITLRESGTHGEKEKEKTFQLIKLHGSINWFHSGKDVFPGEQIYYRHVNSKSPSYDMINESVTTKETMDRLTKDKDPLIIPPVMEKSSFYVNQTVRTLWSDARKALAGANEVYFVGYSLPETDLTLKLLFYSIDFPEKIYTVNLKNSETKRLKRRYRITFPEDILDYEYIKEEYAVEKMVEKLVNDG